MSQQRHRLLYIVCSFLLLAGLSGVIVERAAIARQMHAWKLLPEPERLTELYFTDHTTLPSSYAPDQSQTVAFTVHNLEYQTTNYTYTITQSSEDGSQHQDLASGKFSLIQDQFQKASVPVTLADLGTRSQITVTLTNTHESIHYWVNRSAS